MDNVDIIVVVIFISVYLYIGLIGINYGYRLLTGKISLLEFEDQIPLIYKNIMK